MPFCALGIDQDNCNANTVGALTASSGGTTVTASGSTNTMGSFTAITAASPCDCAFIGIDVYNASVAGEIAVNIAVGGAGSEQVIIQQLVVDQAGSAPCGATYLFPVAIPAGTRISAQCQSSHASATCKVVVYLFDAGFNQMEGCAGVDALGFVPSTTLGTSLTANVSANTKATSFTTLAAATARDYCSLSAYFDSLNTTATNAQYLIDLAIGAASSEQIIIPNLFMQVSSIAGNGPCITGFAGPFPIPIPAGTRLSARTQCSTGSGKIGCTLYGVYQ